MLGLFGTIYAVARPTLSQNRLPGANDRFTAVRKIVRTPSLGRVEPLGSLQYLKQFAGSLRAGQRAAVIMSLIQSAKFNGHDPYRYLKDILERLSSQPVSRLEELLPHHWRPTETTH